MSNPKNYPPNTDVITYTVTSDEAKAWHEKRASQHEAAAAAWEKRAEDPIWCARTSVENAKKVKAQALKDGRQISKDEIADQAGIATFARDQARANREHADLARMMGKAIAPGQSFRLSREEYMDLVADVTLRVSPIDPPAPPAEAAASQPS